MKSSRLPNRNFRRAVLGLVAFTLFVLAAACGGDDPTPTPTATATTAPASDTATPTPTATATPSPTATATTIPPTSTATPTATVEPMAMPTSGDLVIALGELNDSGQTGIAVLTAMGDQTVVVLSLSPGTLQTERVHIHTGPCGNDTLGHVVYALTSFVDGSGFSMTTVDVSLASLRDGTFAINSHKAGPPPAPLTYTSCGNIPTKAEAITIALDELSGSGQTGVATLVSQGEMTEVTLLATAGISELNHIHSGSCADLGGVDYPLSSMADGMSVTTVDATLASLQTGDFAINLHKLGDPGTYTSCGNIPVDTMMVGGSTGGTTPPPVTADIANFVLPDLTVTVGTTVTWTNQDAVQHTSTSGQSGQFDNTGWNSPTLPQGQSFTHTFNQEDTLTYTCRIHPSMSGTVTVTSGEITGGSSKSTTGESDSGEDGYDY